MKSEAKIRFSVLSLILAIFMMFAMGSCSFLERNVDKEDAFSIYAELEKTITAELKLNSEDQEDGLAENIASFSIKKIEKTVISKAKTKDVDEIQETKIKTTYSISGDKTNFTLEIAEDDGKNPTTNYIYIKEGKYFFAEEGKTDNPTELTKEYFETAIVLNYLTLIYEIEEGNNLIGTSELKEGFDNAKKGLKNLKIYSKILDKTISVTLEKNLFKEVYKLKKYTRVTKETVDDTTTTEETTIKYTY